MKLFDFWVKIFDFWVKISVFCLNWKREVGGRTHSRQIPDLSWCLGLRLGPPRARVEYPAQEGWNHPFWRSKKWASHLTQLKLFCLTSTQTGNLKMACQHPSCSLSIKKGAVNKHSDWRWKIWRARRALSKFREHNATSFFAHDFTAWWGIPRRYRKS